ncbi:helix-turn-helix domain-containing protein [Stenomitos frigidus]|uniref:helix-turn-helix domain-containing protein n=1 Tax=Stenomitos frigidus TaxID=1886765 RepID=UPI003D64A014
MRNRVKEFLDKTPDPVTGKDKTSAYRFWKLTGLARDTAYKLYNNPDYVPGGEVLDAVCRFYKQQPGEFLVWSPDDETAAS